MAYRLRRLLALLPLLLLTGATPSEPSGTVLNSLRPDAALISRGDLGIATYAMLFVIGALLLDRWLDRVAIGKLTDAIDRASKAEGKRHTALLVQLTILASVVGRELPSVEEE